MAWSCGGVYTVVLAESFTPLPSILYSLVLNRFVSRTIGSIGGDSFVAYILAMPNVTG